jgi:hypothetical protein
LTLFTFPNLTPFSMRILASVVIGKETVNGEVHYLVEWTAALVPKYELGKVKVLG